MWDIRFGYLGREKLVFSFLSHSTVGRLSVGVWEEREIVGCGKRKVKYEAEIPLPLSSSPDDETSPKHHLLATVQSHRTELISSRREQERVTRHVPIVTTQHNPRRIQLLRQRSNIIRRPLDPIQTNRIRWYLGRILHTTQVTISSEIVFSQADFLFSHSGVELLLTVPPYPIISGATTLHPKSNKSGIWNRHPMDRSGQPWTFQGEIVSSMAPDNAHLCGRVYIYIYIYTKYLGITSDYQYP